MKYAIHLCDFRSEPREGGTECHEAIWSRGRACKKCSVACYRVGWDKDRVDLDNARRVRENTGPTNDARQRQREDVCN